MEYQLVKTRMDLFIVKIDYIWARTAAVSGIQSHILKIAVHYLYFTAIAAIEKAEMNDTRGYGSEKKSFTVFLNRWTKALNVRIQSSEKKWGKISRNFIATIVARFSLLLAFHCCWQWWAHSPGDTYCRFNKVASIFMYISIFYFMHIVIYQFEILRRTSPLCSNKKTLYVPIKVCKLLEFNLTSFKLQFRAKC